MSRVIRIRDVPDDVHQGLVEAADAQGLSLSRYLLPELDRLARWTRAAGDNAAVIRDTQAKVRGRVDRETILDALHAGRAE